MQHLTSLCWNIGWGCIQVPLMTINYSAGKHGLAAMNAALMVGFFCCAYYDWKREVKK